MFDILGGCRGHWGALLALSMGTAQAATPTLTTNQSVFTTGNTLTLSATLTPTSDSGVKSDIYVAVVTPTSSLYLDRTLTWGSTMAPVSSGFPLSSLQASNFYSLKLPAVAGGIYNFHVVVTPAGASATNTAARLGSSNAPIIFQSQTPTATACAAPLYCGPIIDNHAHPISADQGNQNTYADGLVALMDQNAVAMTALHRNGRRVNGVLDFSSSHDQWVAAAAARQPGKFLSYLGGFDPSSADALTYIQTQIVAGSPWKAIGELDLRSQLTQTQIAINSTNMMAILKLAGQLRVPVIIHYDFEYGVDYATGVAELEAALTANPDTTIILAHMPVVDLMVKHANLWAEITPWGPQADQTLATIVKSNPTLLDRLVLCATDVQSSAFVTANGLSYATALSTARRMLGTLTQEQAEKIAYKNLIRLLQPFPN